MKFNYILFYGRKKGGGGHHGNCYVDCLNWIRPNFNVHSLNAHGSPLILAVKILYISV